MCDWVYLCENQKRTECGMINRLIATDIFTSCNCEC